MKNKSQMLSWKEVGIDLASIHYGLGFLLGSGAAIYSKGSIGIIYAVASALGLFSLVIIAPYYRNKKIPIWDILGNSYGKPVKDTTAFLSGIWMIGVTASQVLGGASAMMILGVPRLISSIILSIFILILSLVHMKLLSKVFSTMLIISSLVLLIILFSQGLFWIPLSISDFFSNLNTLKAGDLVGTLLTTVLITFIGMDFHQFLVASRDTKSAVKGSIFGGAILLVLSALVLSLVYGAINTGKVDDVLDPNGIVPAILFNFGNSIIPMLGFIISIPILLVSIGSGSGVTRIVSKTIAEFELISKHIKNEKLLNIFAVFLAFCLSLSGKSIIDLIVSFYAVYVGTVFIPFIAHLGTEYLNLTPFNKNSMKISLYIGAAVSIVVLFLSFFPTIQYPSGTSSTIILLGFLTTSLCLFLCRLLERFYK